MVCTYIQLEKPKPLYSLIIYVLLKYSHVTLASLNPFIFQIILLIISF